MILLAKPHRPYFGAQDKLVRCGVAAIALSLAACSNGIEGTGGASSTSSSKSTTGAGLPCGDTSCDPAKEYCGYEPGLCDGPKACHPYGYDCSNVDVTCGCDGVNYAGACTTLNTVGGIRSGGACPAPPGKFNCTYQTQIPIVCDAATEYCQATIGGSNYALACKPYPSCGADVGTCNCMDLSFQACAMNYCGKDPQTGGVTVLCK
jgi:hypothetical protein